MPLSLSGPCKPMPRVSPRCRGGPFYAVLVGSRGESWKAAGSGKFSAEIRHRMTILGGCLARESPRRRGREPRLAPGAGAR
jgi:hypothetical protein